MIFSNCHVRLASLNAHQLLGRQISVEESNPNTSSVLQKITISFETLVFLALLLKKKLVCQAFLIVSLLFWRS